MAVAFVPSGEIELPRVLAQLRGQAALVRSLLDELDRHTPFSPRLFARHPDTAQLSALGSQIAEEIERLGARMLECAAAITGTRSKDSSGNRGAGNGHLPAPRPPSPKATTAKR
jgi:hypothetical protein